MDDIIINMRIDLEKARVEGVLEYIKNLQANSDSPNFKDFYLEGVTALMFARAGCSVTIRERKEPPDLALRFNNEQFYAEVKHFREGTHAWEEVYDVAKKKLYQYKEHAPNILVIESSSACIEDTEVLTTINTINEDVRSGKCPEFAKLNGILLTTLGWYNISQGRGVFFYRASNPSVSLGRELFFLLGGIRHG